MKIRRHNTTKERERFLQLQFKFAYGRKRRRGELFPFPLRCSSSLHFPNIAQHFTLWSHAQNGNALHFGRSISCLAPVVPPSSLCKSFPVHSGCYPLLFLVSALVDDKYRTSASSSNAHLSSALPLGPETSGDKNTHWRPSGS